MKKYFQNLHWFLSSQVGIDVKALMRSFLGITPFIIDYFNFKKKYEGKLTLKPCLNDRFESGGSVKSEYFWQDLTVAQTIFSAQPKRHVDIGSRIDGFVAHLATFRQVEVFDIRPISAVIPNITFKQADIMDSTSLLNYESGYCDSLSCLHAIEHFGLGRYGDPINPEGFKIGLDNMLVLLSKNGFFYLSTPIGKERVEFNANHIFNPRTIINQVENNGLKLLSLAIVGGDNTIKDIDTSSATLDWLAKQNYNLGIFKFQKIIDSPSQ